MARAAVSEPQKYSVRGCREAGWRKENMRTREPADADPSFLGPAFRQGWGGAAVHAGGCSSARKTLRLGSHELPGAVVLL